MRKKDILALSLALLVVSIIVSTGKGMSMPTNLDLIGLQLTPAARVDHDPIDIDGNADMLAQKTGNGWTGTGELNSPITIAGYRIEFYDECITIRNVDLYFMIENCETTDIESQYYASTGIKLINCRNGVISNSLAHTKETGIFVKNCEHITVEENTVHDCAAGISVEDCYYVNIYKNNFNYNDFVGVNITGSSSCTVYQNTICSIPYFGIMCIVDTNTFMSGNLISSTQLEDEAFDHIGILSYYSVNIAIHNATISDCSTGLEMQNTDGAWIWECCILGTIEYGIYLDSDTYNVTIIQSCILPSECVTAYDAGEANSWDNPYDEVGNFWGDYNGTGYYYISGPAESIDHFPNRFECECSDGNYTGGITSDLNTTSNVTGFGGVTEPLVMMIAIGSSFVILIVVVLVIRSNKSY